MTRHTHRIIFIFYAVLVAYVSLHPIAGAGVGDWDKLMHLLVYYIFAVFAYRALGEGRGYWFVCLGIVGYSALLEIAQSYVPGRFMSGYDLLASTLGVVLGAVVAMRVVNQWVAAALIAMAALVTQGWVEPPAGQTAPAPELSPPMPVRTPEAYDFPLAIPERALEPASVEALPVTTPPDYAAAVGGENLPPEIRQLLQDAYVEFAKGNIEQAAQLGIEALNQSNDYPALKPMLYSVIGYSYENLGYIDMAIEQYQAALSLYPEQRTSYDGMRRLDPEFAAAHPELPVPPAKPPTETQTGTTR